MLCRVNGNYRVGGFATIIVTFHSALDLLLMKILISAALKVLKEHFDTGIL